MRGHYKEQHGLIPTHGNQVCSGTMQTLHLLLDDIKVGSELSYSELDKDIKPKKGRTVNWLSICDEDMTGKQDCTSHKGILGKRGKKYDAELCFHPLNTREAMEDYCPD